MEFAFKFENMQHAKIAIGPDPVSVTAMVNGKKVRIGEGRINPETMIFTTTIDNFETNPNAKIYYDTISAGVVGGDSSLGGMVSVSEFTFYPPEEHKRIRDIIERTELAQTKLGYSTGAGEVTTPMGVSRPIDDNRVVDLTEDTMDEPRVIRDARIHSVSLDKEAGLYGGQIHLVNVCPECRAGKHVNCNGQAWDDLTDKPTECACPDASHEN